MSQRRVRGVPRALVLVVWFLASCKTGPAPPRMGTPEWYWSAARERYGVGDFAKTQEHLEKLMDGESQYKARAATWHLVVLAGMARGYRELADAYEEGAPFAKAQTAEFRRTVNDLRRQSRTYTIGLAEEASRWRKDLARAEKVTLEFAFPIGSPAEPPVLLNVRKGILPPESDRAKLHRDEIARGILLQTAAVVGQEPLKAAELFKTQPVEVPTGVFLYGMAESLVNQSALFDRKRLQEPDKKKILLELAEGFATAAAQSQGDEALRKKIKDLQARIEKERKSIGKV